MALLMKGKPVADALDAATASQVEALRPRGVVPVLAIVRVGAREDNLSYERAAEKRCQKLGIDLRKFLIPADGRQEDLMAAIAEVNGDPNIHGCLLLRPLPLAFSEQAACDALDPAKDVDGITARSLFGVFAGEPCGFAPCTAEACLRLLEHYEIPLSGAKAAVVGRSLVIGRPVASLLTAAHATVTLCHSRTADVARECAASDIVVVASGHPNTLGASGVHAGQVVVDVGMNWDEASGRFVGDVDFAAVEPIVSAITPVPGGVGAVTTAVLASHVAQAAAAQTGGDL